MRRLLFFFLIGLNCLQLAYSQQVKLQFRLIDKTTQMSIPDANIFINNSRLGTASDINGYFELKVSPHNTQELIITHLLYETLIISSEQYHKFEKGATIEMQSKSENLNEIVLSAKNNNKWKRNFRRFKKTLLGKGKAASKCEILNPEVLQFEEKNGNLSAKAMDLLHIENDYLGYTLRFWLEELLIEKDGSTYYKGYVHFIDKAEANNTRFINKREKHYTQSIPHFLRSLLESTNKADLKGRGYEVSFERYENGAFLPMPMPSDPSMLIDTDSVTGGYRLYIPEILKVEHIGLKVSSADQVKVGVSSAEQQAFGSSSTQSLGGNRQNAVSRLYSTEFYLLFDDRGNIINKSAVREYGFWAEQRLATNVPIDYNVDWDMNTEVSVSKPIDTLSVFQNLIGADKIKKEESLNFLKNNWSQTYLAPLLDILRLSQDDWQQQVIRSLLDENVPAIKADYYNGIQSLWKDPPNYGNYYADFKAYLYSALDPAFYKYFNKRGDQTKIRLDEIIWGGVRQDGIPPLILPKLILAGQASYLTDTDVVFGLVINGEARAYPKRILAWHELLNDEIDGRSITAVYCTLCGTVIIYDNEFNGVKHKLGTSGFLYRSNKLMYDQATQSLWSTFLGQPVVGPLIDQNIELTTLPVETTSWGDWRLRHPNTKVLSIETGHDRNYDEGEAYKEYFAHDNLMFPIIRLDKRLPNKTRVFIPRPKNFEVQPLAISVDFLKRKRIYQDQIDEQKMVIITESNGASRAYGIDDQHFKSYKNGRLLDNKKEEWVVTEDALIGPEGDRLLRLPAHEAFWFAWINVFPETRIIY